MTTSKKSNSRGSRITPRHAWLAALGVVAVARREAFTAAEVVIDEAIKVRKQAIGMSADARAIARGGVITLGEKIEPLVAQFSTALQARLGPVMDKFGVPHAATRAPRKTTRRTTARSRG